MISVQELIVGRNLFSTEWETMETLVYQPFWLGVEFHGLTIWHIPVSLRWDMTENLVRKSFLFVCFEFQSTKNFSTGKKTSSMVD